MLGPGVVAHCRRRARRGGRAAAGGHVSLGSRCRYGPVALEGGEVSPADLEGGRRESRGRRVGEGGVTDSDDGFGARQCVRVWRESE